MRQVLRRAAVSIGGLYDSDPNLFIQTRCLDQIDDKCCDQCGNLVSIKHVELATIVVIEIDEPVSVTIKTAATLSGLQDGAKGWGKLLLGLDEIGATLIVKYAGSSVISVVQNEREYVAKMCSHLCSTLRADTVGTIYHQWRGSRFSRLYA